jgi:hypothetical protein
MAVDKKVSDNPWEDIEIESWPEFEDLVEKLPTRQWVFRGHSDANWKLQSSICRLFDDFMKMREIKMGERISFIRPRKPMKNP